MNESESIFTAGGIATVVTAVGFIVGLFTKYWIDRRKLDGDSDDKMISILQTRVTALEADNKACLERNAEMSREFAEQSLEQAKQVGFLQARCETLERCCETLRQKLGMS